MPKKRIDQLELLELVDIHGDEIADKDQRPELESNYAIVRGINRENDGQFSITFDATYDIITRKFPADYIVIVSG